MAVYNANNFKKIIMIFQIATIHTLIRFNCRCVVPKARFLIWLRKRDVTAPLVDPDLKGGVKPQRQAKV